MEAERAREAKARRLRDVTGCPEQGIAQQVRVGHTLVQTGVQGQETCLMQLRTGDCSQPRSVSSPCSEVPFPVNSCSVWSFRRKGGDEAPNPRIYSRAPYFWRLPHAA